MYALSSRIWESPLSKATFIRASWWNSSDFLRDDFTWVPQAPRTSYGHFRLAPLLFPSVRPERIIGLGPGVGGALWDHFVPSHGHGASTWTPLSPSSPLDSLLLSPYFDFYLIFSPPHNISPGLPGRRQKSPVAPYPSRPDQSRAPVPKSLNAWRGKKLEDLGYGGRHTANPTSTKIAKVQKPKNQKIKNNDSINVVWSRWKS